MEEEEASLSVKMVMLLHSKEVLEEAEEGLSSSSRTETNQETRKESRLGEIKKRPSKSSILLHPRRAGAMWLLRHTKQMMAKKRITKQMMAAGTPTKAGGE